MKKLVITLLIALLALTGCSTGSNNSAKKVKVGSYALTTPFKLSDAKSAQVNVILATVVLDGEGKIVNVNFDAAQNTVEVSDKGVATLPTETPTKKEKGDAYGMKKASSIGKEWHEQIMSLEAALKGKTVKEVQEMKLDDAGHFEDADLKSSVTITATPFVEAVVKAAEMAQEVQGEVASIGTASQTAISDKAPADGKNGTLTFNTTFGYVTLDKDGKILNAYIDVAQNKVAYKADGTFAESNPSESKQVLKEAYGMKEASPIKKEWFEQANGFTASLVGKTEKDLKEIKLDEQGHATDADLLATTTIHVNGFVSVLEQAFQHKVELAK